MTTAIRTRRRLLPFALGLLGCAGAGAPGGGGSGGASVANGGAAAGGNGGADATVADARELPESAPVDRVIAACNGLGGVDELQDITPPGTDLSNNGVVQVLVHPKVAGTVYAGVDRRGLFKSTDCGASWTKVNTGRNGSLIDTGTPWSMAMDPVLPDVIYAGSLYGQDNSLLKSVNGGVDWDSLWPRGSEIASTVEYNFLQDLSIDPTDHQHVVVTFHANCKSAFGTGCMAETKDAGVTWRIFKSPKPGWQEGAGPFVLGATTWLVATVQQGFYYTGDGGETWEQVGPGANHSMYRTQDGHYYTGSDYGVNRSADGRVWMQVPGSPNGYGMIGDGKRLFHSVRNAEGTQQPYFTSPETDGTKWTPLPSPRMSHGAVYFAYDRDHHLLYSANTKSGLWRMVTQ